MDWNKFSKPDPEMLGDEMTTNSRRMLNRFALCSGHNAFDKWIQATVEKLPTLPRVFSPDWSAIEAPEPWAVMDRPRIHLVVLGHCPELSVLLVSARRGLWPTDSMTVVCVGRVDVTRLTVLASRGIVVLKYRKQGGRA